MPAPPPPKKTSEKPRDHRSVLPAPHPMAGEDPLPRLPPNNLQARRKAERARREQKARQEASKREKTVSAQNAHKRVMAEVRKAGGKPKPKPTKKK